MKKTVAFCTLGCKVNQYETDAMRGSFEAEGYEAMCRRPKNSWKKIR